MLLSLSGEGGIYTLKKSTIFKLVGHYIILWGDYYYYYFYLKGVTLLLFFFLIFILFVRVLVLE